MNIELKRLSRPLKNIKVIHVSSTRQGGGVAEMLHFLIPALNGLGLKVEWFVPKFTQEFFAITKKFHNMLQGLEQNITLDELGYYLDTVKKVRVPKADLYIVHDPQVLPINVDGPKVWRCHIQTTGYNKPLMNILLPYINTYNGAIWTDNSFVPEEVNIPVYTVSPCIDPRNVKNQIHTGKYAQYQLELPPNVPIISSVSRFDLHKNQKTTIEAFNKLNNTSAHLVVLGNFAVDDPEGGRVYSQLREFRTDNIHVRAIDDARLVGSLNAVSDVFVHVSVKEGFGLVVSEAMIQGTPVIGSNVGGIPKQVLHGYTGWLVDPYDVEKIAFYMDYALSHSSDIKNIGRQCREWVMKNFVIENLIKDHLMIYQMFDRR